MASEQRKKRTRRDAPITTTVVRSLEPVDVDAFLDRYFAAIIEANGWGPTHGPFPPPHASTEAPSL